MRHDMQTLPHERINQLSETGSGKWGPSWNKSRYEYDCWLNWGFGKTVTRAGNSITSINPAVWLHAANAVLSSSLWQHGISHVKAEALAALKAMGVSSFISMRLWFLSQCLVKNVYLRFLSHPEVFSLFYYLMMQLLSNPVRMVFRAQSWGWPRVGGQLRGCSWSPSLWRKVPGGCGLKLPHGIPVAGRSKLFQELGAVLGKLAERGNAWPLLPSCLFPHVCKVSAETIKERLWLFPLGWHISVPHQCWPGTTGFICPKVSVLPR